MRGEYARAADIGKPKSNVESRDRLSRFTGPGTTACRNQRKGQRMKTKKLSPEAVRRVDLEAQRILRSPKFFQEFLEAMEEEGLLGEQGNALVLLIASVSRLFPRPLSVFVKGSSSSGKNWLVSRVLRLLPAGRVREITSASDKAWNYSQDSFRNRIVYLQERNQATGRVHPVRLLISEGKLVRIVPRWIDGKLVTKKYVARGPVAAFSTTTRSALEIDDETRHISIVTDESPEQTRRIVQGYTKQGPGLCAAERQIWKTVHRLIEQRAKVEVIFPSWFQKVAALVSVDDVRVRRYYPIFVEACRAVCLIRSFQREPLEKQNGKLILDFADFAVAALILERIFVQSMHRHEGTALEVRQAVEAISATRGGKPVQAEDLARELGISRERAYEKLREAVTAGAVCRVNASEKDNRKFFLPASAPRFLPDPEKLFQKLDGVQKSVRFVHPLTGEWVTYVRAKQK